MFSTIFAIRSSDPDTHFRGMLLKGIALILGIGSLLDVCLIYAQYQTLNAPLIGALAAFLITCITFGLAHTGFVTQGSFVLASVLFLIVGRVVPSETLLNSPMVMAFLFPLLIIGLTVNALAAAGFAGVMITILTFALIIGFIPNSGGSVLSLLLLSISSVFIWLIMFTLERGRNQARQQNKDLQAAQKVILAREEELQHSNDQMLKKNTDLEHMLELVNQLETPIIPLTQESLIVPLVGHLDTRRIEHIREMVLETVYQTHVHYVLIDLTGIAVIDTGVISRLNHTIKCIHLLGTEVLLTGIRAETAITMTTLGVDFTDVWTSANLSDGVRHVLRQISV